VLAPAPEFRYLGWVKARLWPASQQERTALGVMSQVETWAISVPAATDISFQDEVEDGRGWRYRVLTVVDRRAADGSVHHRTALLGAITREGATRNT